MLSMPDSGRPRGPAPEEALVPPGRSRQSLLRAGVLGGAADAALAAAGIATDATSATAAASPAALPQTQNLFTLTDLVVCDWPGGVVPGGD